MKKWILFFAVVLMSGALSDTLLYGQNSKTPIDTSMKMAYGWSTKAAETEAVKEAVSMMEKGLGGNSPKLVVIFTTGENHNQKKVFSALKNMVNSDTRIWGLSSDVAGVVAPEGIHNGITLMGFYAPGMTVGVAKAPINWQDTGSYRAVGKMAITEALKDAGKSPKDPPKLILFAGPGLITDTDILRGMEDVAGRVMMWGGNSGNVVMNPTDSPLGLGWFYYNVGVDSACVTAAAIWTKSKIGISYGYGYTEVSEKTGKVTKADVKKRIVYTIDNRPAADVFNEWIGGQITDQIAAGGGPLPLSIIGKYSLKKPGRGSDYILVMPAVVFPDKSMFMTHEAVDVGTTLTLMEIAQEEEVVNKPSAIATIARIKGNIARQEVAGSLFAYCCAPFYISKQSGYDLSKTFPLLNKTLNNTPYAGFLAGGEVGCTSDLETKMLYASTVMLIFGKY